MLLLFFFFANKVNKFESVVEIWMDVFCNPVKILCVCVCVGGVCVPHHYGCWYVLKNLVEASYVVNQ